jgi:hypothetical protein
MAALRGLVPTGLSFQELGFKVLPRTAAKTSKLAAEIADGRPAKKAIIVLFVQELDFKVLPRTRLRRPRSSPRRSRMAAWPIGRSTACSSRSLSLRCCLGPGCEDFEAHRGDCSWPPGHEGDHRPVNTGTRLQGVASDPAAKTSKIAA